MGWGPPQAGPAGDAWAAFPEEIVLVKIPASKPPSCTASGRALGATCSRSPSYQVPEEPGFSLVLEAVAFLVGPAQFLGSEASQVGICPAGAGGVLERAPGKGSHPLCLSLQGWGLQLLQPRPPRKQLSTVSAPWGGQPRPRCPQPPTTGALDSPVLQGWVDLASVHLWQPLSPSPQTCNVPTSLPLPILATLSGRPLFSMDWPSSGVGMSHGAPDFSPLTLTPPPLHPLPGGPAERLDFALDLDGGFPILRPKPSELRAGSSRPPCLSDGWNPSLGPATPTAPRAVPLEAL